MEELDFLFAEYGDVLRNTPGLTDKTKHTINTGDLPLIDEILDQVGESQYLSKLDLTKESI